MSKQTSNGTPHHLLKIIGCPLSSGSPKQYRWLRSRSRESSLPRHCATLLVWVHAAWLLSYLGSKAGGSPYIIATADFWVRCPALEQYICIAPSTLAHAATAPVLPPPPQLSRLSTSVRSHRDWVDLVFNVCPYTVDQQHEFWFQLTWMAFLDTSSQVSRASFIHLFLCLLLPE